MGNTIEIGRKGEMLAIDHLEKSGYTILGQNVRVRHLELDVIAQKGEELVFVEVKTRKANSLHAPEVAMNHKKRQNLIKAARTIFETWDVSKLTGRFDLITILNEANGPRLAHLENAFTC
jgi:putative endonuclease